MNLHEIGIGTVITPRPRRGLGYCFYLVRKFWTISSYKGVERLQNATGKLDCEKIAVRVPDGGQRASDARISSVFIA